MSESTASLQADDMSPIMVQTKWISIGGWNPVIPTGEGKSRALKMVLWPIFKVYGELEEFRIPPHHKNVFLGYKTIESAQAAIKGKDGKAFLERYYAGSGPVTVNCVTEAATLKQADSPAPPVASPPGTTPGRTVISIILTNFEAAVAFNKPANGGTLAPVSITSDFRLDFSFKPSKLGGKEVLGKSRVYKSKQATIIDGSSSNTFVIPSSFQFGPTVATRHNSLQFQPSQPQAYSAVSDLVAVQPSGTSSGMTISPENPTIETFSSEGTKVETNDTNMMYTPQQHAQEEIPSTSVNTLPVCSDTINEPITQDSVHTPKNTPNYGNIQGPVPSNGDSAELVQLRSQVALYQNRINQISTVVHDADIKYRNMELERDAAIQQTNSMIKQVETLTSQRDAAYNARDSAVVQETKLMKRCDELIQEGSLDKCHTSCISTETHQMLQRDFDDLVRKKASQEKIDLARIDSLERKASQLEQLNTAHNNSIESTKQSHMEQLDDFKRELKEGNSVISNLSQTIDDLKSENKKIGDESTETDSRLKAAEKVNTDQLNTISTLEKQNDELKVKLERCQTRNAHLEVITEADGRETLKGAKDRADALEIDLKRARSYLRFALRGDHTDARRPQSSPNDERNFEQSLFKNRDEAQKLSKMGELLKQANEEAARVHAFSLSVKESEAATKAKNVRLETELQRVREDLEKANKLYSTTWLENIALLKAKRTKQDDMSEPEGIKTEGNSEPAEPASWINYFLIAFFFCVLAFNLGFYPKLPDFFATNSLNAFGMSSHWDTQPHSQQPWDIDTGFDDKGYDTSVEGYIPLESATLLEPAESGSLSVLNEDNYYLEEDMPDMDGSANRVIITIISPVDPEPPYLIYSIDIPFMKIEAIGIRNTNGGLASKTVASIWGSFVEDILTIMRPYDSLQDAWYTTKYWWFTIFHGHAPPSGGF